MLTPQKLEPGRFASRPDVAPEVKTNAFIHNDKLYVPQETYEQLTAICMACVKCLADMSAIWFTHKLAPDVVAARFVPTGGSSPSNAEVPAWAAAEYPCYVASVAGLLCDGQTAEIACILALSTVTITSKLFQANWAALNVQSMDKITIDTIDIEYTNQVVDEVVDAPGELTPSPVALSLRPAEPLSEAAEVELVNPDSLLAPTGDASAAMRVIRLKRVEPQPVAEIDDEVRRAAKKRVRRAKMKALLARMSAQREEEDFRERYPVDDGESSFGYSDTEYERDEDEDSQSDNETADSNGDGQERHETTDATQRVYSAPHQTVVVRKL